MKDARQGGLHASRFSPPSFVAPYNPFGDVPCVKALAKSERAGSQDAVSLLAVFLYAKAGAESVRTREALAATIANQVRGLLSELAASTPNSLD